MHLIPATSYVDGLVNMASSCSKYIGPSYMHAICFNKKDYINDFKDFYHIKKEKVELIETNMSLKDFIQTFFGDNKEIIEGLAHWLYLEAGDVKKVLTIKEDSNLIDILSGANRGLSGFFFLEEIYFIEFEKMIICFTVGNDE